MINEEVEVRDDREILTRKTIVFPYRIFGVGMNKTGTCTLGRAIQRLGIGPIASEDAVQNADIIDKVLHEGDYEPALRFAGIYRFFEDRPWNVYDMYRRLDERYPGSRFILTTRSPESWWKSVHRWITVTKPRMAETYRVHLKADTLSEKDMVAGYLRYNQEVVDYFRGRSDFLSVDFGAGDKWEPLCNFLGLPVPDLKFPHANKQSYSDDDSSLMLRRKLRKVAVKREKPKNTVPGISSCVNCGEKLEVNRRGKKNHTLMQMPAWVKEPYRILQRGAFHYSQMKINPERKLALLREAHPDLRIDDMAVVTSFFNPSGYRTRTENYWKFKKSMEACGLPVLTVELAFGQDPHLLGPDAGNRIELRAPHPMWQKERLLNIGIAKLIEQGYRKIVWLDADVVFENRENWPWFVAAELENHSVCQVFKHVLMDGQPGESPIPGMSSIQYLKSVGSWLVQDRRGPTRKRWLGVLNGYSGFGWAARAEVLKNVPLYDRSIMGGGDKQIYYASCPLPENWQERLGKMFVSNFNPCGTCNFENKAPRYIADYFDWAATWNQATGGKAGRADLTLRSLYHGELQNRHYRLRRDILLRHEFDPAADLAIDESGCWRWNSDKPLLHYQVHSYFFDRKEDHVS